MATTSTASTTCRFRQMYEPLRTYLKNAQYKDGTLEYYDRSAEKIEKRLLRAGIPQKFDSETLEWIVQALEKDAKESNSARSTFLTDIRVANATLEFHLTGTISYRYLRDKKTWNIASGILAQFEGYLDFRKLTNATESTIACIRSNLYSFGEYITSLGYVSIEETKKEDLISFPMCLGACSPSVIRDNLMAARGLLRYCFDEEIMQQDISHFVPKCKKREQLHIPTVYSAEETSLLLKTIDRASPVGKRDYPMVLLATRLGLRACDITRLSFSNLHWDTSTIEIFQKKTQEPVVFPLTSEVGDAIIDYIRYARPVVDSKNIFMKMIPPFKPISSPTLGSIVTKYLKEARIPIGGRKHGPHALRFSLTGRLLENKTPLPIISEILGHTNTNTTMSYLRIDIAALRQCNIEVPPFNGYIQEEVTK